ncbi:MAG: Sec-independent protein translocase protein TatB [Alphaproteobacteria bacterium]|nr:Sec-independent protein translocase protein TatB [Alphaproteobacteria bacterium]
MLDIGWSEMLMIAVVAIVVIGPKDLPRALRSIGQWVAKARAMTRDLQNSVNDMIAETEIDELRKAGESLGEFGAPDMMGPDFEGGKLMDHSKSENPNDEYPTPPPTPVKWPPDDEIDASDEELAEYEAEHGGDDEEFASAAAAIDEAEDDAKSKSADG